MIKYSNKRIGNKFEKETADLLSKNGYWVHLLQQNYYGQPADMIAVKGDLAILIDCKYCKTDTFKLSRIEPNQHSSMAKWMQCDNHCCGFAIKFKSHPNKIYFVSYRKLEELMNLKNQKQISYAECRMIGDVLDANDY